MKEKINVTVLFLGIFLLCFFSLPSSAGDVSPSTARAVKKDNHPPKINLNTADLKGLTHSFKGLGKRRAQAIIAYRETHPFNSVEDLAQVKGFGSKFVKANLKQLNATFVVEDPLLSSQ